jgi:hypothetical protein
VARRSKSSRRAPKSRSSRSPGRRRSTGRGASSWPRVRARSFAPPLRLDRLALRALGRLAHGTPARTTGRRPGAGVKRHPMRNGATSCEPPDRLLAPSTAASSSPGLSSGPAGRRQGKIGACRQSGTDRPSALGGERNRVPHRLMIVASARARPVAAGCAVRPFC